MVSRNHYFGPGFNQRTYYHTAKWQQIRDGFLARNPVCYGCGNVAETVHHDRYTYLNLSGIDEGHLYAICRRCHYWIHFHKGKKVKGGEQVTNRLRVRRRAWVVDRTHPLLQRADAIHEEIDNRLTFLINETD